MSANTALMEISAVSGQDSFMTPLVVPNSALTVEEQQEMYINLSNPFVAEYDTSIKFARVENQIPSQGTIDFSQKATVMLESTGIDLAVGLILEVTLPAIAIDERDETGEKVRWCGNPGHNIVLQTICNIGGQDIEIHNSMWWDISMDLKLCCEGARRAYNESIGQQNHEIIRIGIDNTADVTYLATGDIVVQAFDQYVDSGGAVAGDLFFITVAQTATDIAVVPAGGAVGTYVPESLGILEQEGITVTGFNGLQTFKTQHAATHIKVYYKFWWCDAPHLALPVISIMLQSIQIHTQFRSFLDCIEYKLTMTPGPTSQVTDISNKHLTDQQFYVIAIYTDSMTRDAYTRYRGQQMVQLIDCISPVDTQRSLTTQNRVNTSHPSDELIWTIFDSRNATWHQWTNFYCYNADRTLVPNVPPMLGAQLMFQNQPRTAIRSRDFFRNEIVLRSHKNVPRGEVYFYCFSLDPEAYQPYGTANFSRLDNVSLNLLINGALSETQAYLCLFNRHRNFIRITSGMLGKVFAS